MVSRRRAGSQRASHEDALRGLLKMRSASPPTLKCREGSLLEFKETFNWGSRGSYARAMASFANNKGGYIVFGVKPSPHVVVGLKGDHFDTFEPAKATTFFNDCLSPELLWEIGSFEFAGRRVGFIYCAEGSRKPVVCTKTVSDELKDGDIYFRYRAQSRTIRYSELRDLIDEAVQRERRAWQQVLSRVSLVGPTNVGVLDTVHGRIYGAGPPYLIDEKLVRELSFIREGTFSESDGDPTLRVIGEVQSVSGVSPARIVPVAVHYSNIVEAFLAERPMSRESAQVYLAEVARQSSPYVPLRFLLTTSQITTEEAATTLGGVAPMYAATAKQLARHLRGDVLVSAYGKVIPDMEVASAMTEQVAQQFARGSAIEARSFALSSLRKRPDLVEVLAKSENRLRLLEAVTHLGSDDLGSCRQQLYAALLKMLLEEFDTMKSADKTAFRKAVFHLDRLVPVGNRR